MDAKILYTDRQIEALRSMPKRVINPNAAWTEKRSPTHAQRERKFDVVGQLDGMEKFKVYQRRSMDYADNFSCGISYDPPRRRSVMLARYNGPSHKHGEIVFETHIHTATQAAMIAGDKPDSFAEVTDRFETIEGALDCLKRDFNIEGFPVEQDVLGLSDDH